MYDVRLPSKLEHLALSTFVDQPLDTIVLPKSLKVLEFGLFFDQPLQGVMLPAGLEALVLSELYEHDVEYLHLSQRTQVCRWFYADEIVSDLPEIE